MPKRAIPAYHEPELRKLAQQYHEAMEVNEMIEATGLAFQIAGYVEALFGLTSSGLTSDTNG